MIRLQPLADAVGVSSKFQHTAIQSVHYQYRHALYSISSPKVHVQITMEDTIGLRRIQVPDELSVDKRRGGRHHLSIGGSVHERFRYNTSATIHLRHKPTQD